ncbi:MAG: hypothetical protein NVSMB29_04320 [Candidatus Dormibacteria bacterium]
MTVIVNGAPTEVPEHATVAEIVVMVTERADARGIAVARNGDVILRSAWAETRLAPDDRVEVLHAVQGG